MSLYSAREVITITAGTAIDAFGHFFSRFHWISLASALLLAIGCWLHQRHRDPALARSGLLGYLFPARIWLHRSALLDYRFVLFDKVLLGALLGAGALFVVPGGDEAIVAASELFAGEVAKEVGEDLQRLPGLMIAYTAALLLMEDFLRYWAHRLMHSSKLLWQFHKVHHSSEVLVPFSQMRTHPVNGLVNLLRSTLAIGLVTGMFQFLYPQELNIITILGINAGRFFFDFLGSHLRHSHVWLSWGPGLSHVLISPAQHQIHHSRARRHWNRNFASQFALWDWLFGTLYVPRRREQLAFGLGEKEGSHFRTVGSLYLQPFRDARAVLGVSRLSVHRPSRSSDQAATRKLHSTSRSWKQAS